MHKSHDATRYAEIQMNMQTSSRLKSTPPIGAPNATPTPAAEAAESICITDRQVGINEQLNTTSHDAKWCIYTKHTVKIH